MKLLRPGKGAQRKFRNEPPTDFSRSGNREAMEQALRHVYKRLGREYPLMVGGCKVTTRQKSESRNPSHPDQVIGVFQEATAGMVSEAVEAANRAFEHWKSVAFEERAAC